jgi:hypothetical protein
MYDDCKADAGKLSHVGDVGLNIDFPLYSYNNTPILNISMRATTPNHSANNLSEDVWMDRSLLFLSDIVVTKHFTFYILPPHNKS